MLTHRTTAPLLPDLRGSSIMVMSAADRYRQIYLALLTQLKRMITGRREPPEDPYS
jgi:hypothetical protein